jgi:uncharacterized protein
MSLIAGGRTMPEKKKRGFACMTAEQQKAISSKGGKIAHERKTAHRWTSEEAREAGRRGGIAAHANRIEEDQP